jgi:DNA repair protein RadB
MINSGNIDLDNFLNVGYKDITIIYGPAASGKTTLALLASLELAKQKKRVLFIDTENGFSLDRMKQMNPLHKELLDYIFLFKVNNFQEQNERIEEISKIINKFSLIVIDTIGNHYRNELKSDIEKINRELLKQLRTLKHYSKDYNIPIIINNQVYTNVHKKEIDLVGGKLVRNFSNCLLELKKDPRKIVMKKPEQKEMYFKIIDAGIVKT